MAKQRILFVSHKISPYLPVEETSLGKNFPQKLAAEGYEVRTFMPKFGTVNERRNQLHEVIRLSGINIPINNNDHPLVIKVASLQPSRVQVYFIDNDDYFTKQASDDDVLGSNRKDNDERAIFFSHGTADTVKKLRWEPDIVHVSGWITALLPLYIKELYSNDTTYYKTKIIYSVFPGEITTKLDNRFLGKLEEEGFKKEILDGYAKEPLRTSILHKIGIDFSDAVIFHTPDTNDELHKYAKAKKKTVLQFEQLDEDGDKIIEFYKRLIDEK